MAENFLSQEEVDALLKGVNGDQDDAQTQEDVAGVRTYNLATQERIVRGRMPTLEIINERFARLFRIAMPNSRKRFSSAVMIRAALEGFAGSVIFRSPCTGQLRR